MTLSGQQTELFNCSYLQTTHTTTVKLPNGIINCAPQQFT